jgi:hypothetical protein
MTVIERLANNLPEILGRITLSQLSRYDQLQTLLGPTDVSADPDYQRIFNGYYRMQRRRQDWYGHYFSLLEREKANCSLSFREVLNETYDATRRVEPSFSSKLVATIRPEMPIYDKYVRENLLLKPPGRNKTAQVRVAELVALYSDLESKVSALVQNPVYIEKVRPEFDKAFRSYVHFTDVKKLDLLLWQNRPGNWESSGPTPTGP